MLEPTIIAAREPLAEKNGSLARAATETGIEPVIMLHEHVIAFFRQSG